MKLQALDHVHLCATDRAKAEAWYRDVLQLHQSQELGFSRPSGVSARRQTNVPLESKAAALRAMFKTLDSELPAGPRTSV